MDPILALVAIAAVAAAIYAWIFFRRYIAERQEHRRVLTLFSRYVPAPVVEELLARRDPRLFHAREYYATILCCRIRNFALFSEPLTAQETLDYLNEFYTIVGKAVVRNHGMIESLRGDTVIAVFGVLLEETFQEERALRASLDVMRMIKTMEARWKAQSRKPIGVGIGVNSGKIVAGDTGFAQRREFAIIGNPADVAARLEHASEELNATVIASETTFNPVRELFVGVPTSSLPLHGLRRLHNAYIIRGLRRSGAAEEDYLTVPSRAFTKTVVTAGEPAEHIVPEPPPERPERIDAATTPATIVDTRSTALVAEQTAFSTFDDAEPAMPDLPLASTYEDDQGPPVVLPP